VSSWTDGKGDERIIYMTTGYRLVSLNAKTGQTINSFGTSGVVDLKTGVVKGTNQQIDLESGEIGIHSTPAVTRDVVIVGSAFREGMTVSTHNNSKGLVRAFDVRTGKLLWTFNTIPRPGEFGNNTWEENSWSYNGNTGVWTQISVDEELGLAYLPVETPTSDFYGGHRPGNNLFSESLVAVDLKTGVRSGTSSSCIIRSGTHNCCAPILADVTIDGKPRKVVAQRKQAWLMCSTAPRASRSGQSRSGRCRSPTSPGEDVAAEAAPTKPPYARNYFRVPTI
jgi:quinoprotein glucose dehydrogenase